MDIEKREELDYKAFENLIKQKGNKTEPHKTEQYAKYDAWTEKDGKTVAVVELKTREDYHLDDFETFLLSLHKISELQEAKRLNDAQKSILVAFYPLDNKTVIFDLSDLTDDKCDIKWIYTYKTHYMKEKGKTWQPYAQLNLKEGNHGNYSTKIIEQELGFLKTL